MMVVCLESCIAGVPDTREHTRSRTVVALAHDCRAVKLDLFGVSGTVSPFVWDYRRSRAL